MSNYTLTFDAVSEAEPGPKWRARWGRSWPAYEAWFLARGGERGPSRAEAEAALRRHMPELLPVHRKLVALAGGSDRAARFLATWCPPAYLGGCSVAAHASDGAVRLVRNYDLSPDLNEGLLLRTAWTGMPVMGMVEFLWGLSDGINQAGLSVALSYGGSRAVAPGFGVTTILRHVLETCADVEAAVAVLRRVPSHMAYNVTLADRSGATSTVELSPGGGARILRPAIATNHQHGESGPAHAALTSSRRRHGVLQALVTAVNGPEALCDRFLEAPLFQDDYAGGFGTLFTADYDPIDRGVTLRWQGQRWEQRLDGFAEGRRRIVYDSKPRTAEVELPSAAADPIGALLGMRRYLPPAAAARLDRWAANARGGDPDWAGLGHVFA
jgi:predicted choloylglycine hydrolase